MPRKTAPKRPDPIPAKLRASGKDVSRFTQDAWQNSYTGMGGTQDKSRAWAFSKARNLGYAELSGLYHGDHFAFKVCDLLPRQALRQGAEFKRKVEPPKLPQKPPTPPMVPGAPPAPPGQLKEDAEAQAAAETEGQATGASATPKAARAKSSPGGKPSEGEAEEAAQQAKELRAKLVELGAFSKLRQVDSFARAFGGAALILGLPGSPTSPAPEDASEVKFLTVVDSSELLPCEWYEDPLAAKFGEPKLFEIVPKGAGGQVKPKNKGQNRIHESRLVLFGGDLTTRQVRAELGGWDMSVLQRVLTALEQVNSALSSASYMLNDVSQTVLKTPGLISAIGQLGSTAILERLQTLDRTRSVMRTMLIDEKEELTAVDRGALTYLCETLDRFFQILSSASECPITVLLGKSPAGLNATGESDTRGWYDTIQDHRTQELEPRLLRLVRIVSKGLFPGLDPAVWEVSWPSLWQPTDKEQAELRKLVADTDAIYLNAGVVMAEEIVQTRWGSGRFDPGDYKIDLEARAEAMRMEQKAMAAMGAPGSPEGGPVEPEPGGNLSSKGGGDAPEAELAPAAATKGKTRKAPK